MAQTDIPDPTDDLRAVGPNHLLQICQKRLVDRQEVVDVSKQGLGLVWGDDGGVLAPGEVPERVGIVVLEDLQASDVGAFAGYEFVYDGSECAWILKCALALCGGIL